MSDFDLIEGDVTLRNSDGVEVHLKDGDTFPANITGIQIVGKDDTEARFIAVDDRGRLIAAPPGATSSSQEFTNAYQVDVEHNLGQFPTVRVWRYTLGAAFGAGYFGQGLFGYSGTALPDMIVRENVGFVLFYIDPNNFSVIFAQHESGFVEWMEV